MAWRLAVVAFALAALTGALMRFGAYLGLPCELLHGDVRHAHSHLMFFAWATPALILFSGAALRQAGSRLWGGSALATSAAVGGLLAYLPFLFSGYRLMPVGDGELPVSMMASGLNGVIWYLFGASYLAGTVNARGTPARKMMDAAVGMLMVSTVGVVLLMMEGIGGTATPVTIAANAGFFLTLFADGWFGLGLLAALALRPGAELWGANPMPDSAFGTWAWTLAAGLTVRSGAELVATHVDVVGADVLRALGGGVAAVAWLVLAGMLVGARRRAALGRAAPLAGAVIGLVALKALFELAMATPAGTSAVESAALHVPLLHAYLLGAVSLGLVVAARELWGEEAFPGAWWLAGAVGVMLLALLPLTGLWPVALRGPWALRGAAVTSLLPPLVALVSTVAAVVRARGRAGRPA